ncbi:MAG: chlorite dismutase family protein [Verrucomicrobia bacterium]|nr:chlorite dismutase family protein [Verrucomicrobiota bacterium]
MPLPTVKLSQGIHVMHLFYRLDRTRWDALAAGQSAEARAKLEKLCAQFPGPAQPRLSSYANVGGKADLGFVLYHADLVALGAMHRELEACFPAGALQPVYSFLSVTELPEYVTTDDDLKRMIEHGERKLKPGTPEFDEAFAAAKKRNDEYKHYRLNPELEDWEIMCFYPMNKKRNLGDNWYALDFDTRKKLMGSHAKTGRKYAGRISQLITAATGLDDWEWGVTLIAHQADAVKEIVHEMRFDEVTARFGDFGEFFINLRLNPAQIWEHLKL